MGSKAMDMVSSFRERQLQMQDKQRDLQLAMDGPDWPSEDWPLSSNDAKLVGDAESMITNSLKELNVKLDSIGGLARVHESPDENEVILEQIAVLNEMISGYCDLIEKYVQMVKRTMRSKARTSTPSSRPRQTAPFPPMGGLSTEPSLRDRLMSFSSQGQEQQPFARLNTNRESTGNSGLGGNSLGGGSFNTWPNTAGGSTGRSGLGGGSLGVGSFGSLHSSAFGGFSEGGFGSQHLPQAGGSWPSGLPAHDAGASSEL